MNNRRRPRRSALYVPGSNARALEKCRQLEADVLIFDLEDSVAPDAKEEARSRVVNLVRSGGFGARELVVRANALDSPWGGADLAAIAGIGVAAILLPKVDSPADGLKARSLLDDAGAPAGLALWAMIETLQAVLDAAQIATAAGKCGLTCFVIGPNDLARTTGARMVPGRGPMLAWLSHCVLAARAHGLAILDGVFNDFRDSAGFEAECQQGRDLGMDGKTLIHPGQIAAANAAFKPSEAELADARRIIALFDRQENAGKGAIGLDGRLLERLHAEIAARTLELAAAIAVLERSRT